METARVVHEDGARSDDDSRRNYHRQYYWNNLEKRRAAARLTRWRQRARAMGIDV